MRHSIRIRPNLRQGAIALALLAGVAAPSVVAAQAMIAPTSTPTADALAAHMRALAANPGDLRALIGAGEASAKLGDGAAAMQFFSRAEKIDPRNPRVAAGRGRALVAMERPGEALKYFAEAERLGLSPVEYAGDRGLAYDLMGYPANAQADYRLALSRGADDEITRRLALSLGISGKREEAARLLDTMLRANDRQAWRVQAMVVAMDGDFATADRIAASMMPGFGPNLAPFFRRLPALSPGDRAFAGHFGQLQRTPQRMADASMAPAIGAAPAAPTMLADAGDARREAERQPDARPTRTRDRTQLADNRSSRRSQRNQQSAVRAAVVTDAREPVQMAAAQPAPAPAPAPAPIPTPPARQSSAALAQLASVAPTSASTPPGAMVQAVPSASAPGVTLAAADNDGPVGARLSTSPQGVLRLSRPTQNPVASAPTAAASAPVSTSPAQPGFGTAAAPVATVSAPATATAPANLRAESEDDALARIMRGISVPGSELGVAPMPGATPAMGAGSPIDAAPEPAPVDKAETPPPAKIVEKPAAKPAAKPAPKPAAKKPAAPADPARHWVQVAGGARAADLYKDWDRLAKQSPAAFKGKQGWTTPLRATNRLLAGPFKTPAEAQNFVNAIAKDGISAFAWESEQGQKIEPLKR